MKGIRGCGEGGRVSDITSRFNVQIISNNASNKMPQIAWGGGPRTGEYYYLTAKSFCGVFD